jgi:large repetitive protein
VALCLAGPLSTAHAAISWTGNVDPTDPSTWTGSTTGYVGNTADGTLTVDLDSDLNSHNGYIGYNSGVTGAVTVTGAGSKWTNLGYLYIGQYGNGTLDITGGGAVSKSFGRIGNSSGSTGVVTVDGTGSTWNNHDLYIGVSGNGMLNISGGGAVSMDSGTYVAQNAGSTGTIHFGSGGGTLTTRSLLASPTQLTGAGTINTRGLVSDIDLVFDATHGLSQMLTLNSQPDQNITVNLDMASAPISNGYLGVGYKANASLTICDGIAVNSQSGYIGYSTGSTGVVTVDGTGSKWTNSSGLYISPDGNGTLNISNGGAVSSSSLYVGSSGNGTLNVTGGAVSNSYCYIGDSSGSTGVDAIHHRRHRHQ